MNIVLATDDKFVQHCTVAMLSILSHNSNVHFFILTEGLNEENKTYMSKIVSENNGEIEFCFVPSNIVKYFPMSSLASNHISVATYYRLFITSLLPESIDKVIYLDCDMVIRSSLEDLWNTNINEYALGAVYQDLGWSDHNDCWERLGIPRNQGYFNAGCLLMNLKYLRTYNFQEKAVKYIKNNIKRIISHDQDVLNALFYNQTKMLDCKWNYLSLFLSLSISELEFPDGCKYAEEKCQDGFEPVIVHFVSKPKPWHFGCKNPYAVEYYQYLQQTKWKSFKPKFDFKQYLSFIVIPFLKRAGKKIDIFNLTERRHMKKVRKQYMDQ